MYTLSAGVAIILLTIPNLSVGDVFDLPAVYQITEPIDHAECPTWDPRTGLLYYVDIHSGKIFSYNYSTKKIHFIQLNGEVAPVIPSQNDPNLLIVGLNRSIVAVEWDGQCDLGSQRILVTVQKDQPRSRTNDGKADREGRVWIGTMGYESRDGVLEPNGGILFKVTKDNIQHPTAVIKPVNISNGMAWNKDHNKYYYIDTPTQVIMEFDYDNAKGEISNGRVAFDLRTNGLNSHPDGMTIDKDDNLWIALYGGGSVIKVNPTTGKLLQRVAIPAEAVTSVAWGGPEMDILFVTTSRYALTDAERQKQPAAGSVFAVTNLGTNGLTMFNANIV